MGPSPPGTSIATGRSFRYSGAMGLRAPLLLLAFTLLLPGLSFADPSADADGLFKKAAGLYNQGRPDSAVSVLEQALSLYGDAGRPGKQIEVLNWLGLIE